MDATHPLLAKLALLTLLAAGPAAALAQDEGAADETPERESIILVFGEDQCPPSTDDEVVVCARRPEEERYRIPRPLREANRTPEQSWASRVESLEDASRDMRPGSCSAVGSFGQSGCTSALIRQWQAERRARSRDPY